MIRPFLAAVSFLTRIPVGITFDADDVAGSARWFPIVGALIGGFSVAGLLVFKRIFPPIITGALIVAIGALITGALHLDGLADTADGLGAGRTPEDALRIMRDHAVGSYGAVALILAVVLKVAAIAAMVGRPDAWRYLILAPALGRWSSVLLSTTLPYARRLEETPSKGAVAGMMRERELVISTVLAILIAAGTTGWRAITFCSLVVATTALWGWFCARRIHGVTGDTLGAAVEISEIAALLLAVTQ
ncbi:MAG: adenosylcobinamide-GDP ribazoletransferase [Bryobacteraceae bacterium]|jgi:cobalamin 5'-phosphate synthase/cobalamin synthase